MTLFTRPLTAALGAALVAAAAPGAAHAGAPSHVPVPAGQLQHTVTVISFPAARNTHRHHGLRNERWITATAGREVVTDTITGKVTEDCQYRLTVSRCWSAPINRREPRAGTTYIYAGTPILLQSWDDVGQGVKALLGDPRGYHQTGTTTYLGRDAVTLAQDAQRGPDGGTESATVIADAANDYPLFRDDLDVDQPFTRPDGTKGTEQVEQVTETKVMEVPSPRGVRLSMNRHPRAKVVDTRKLRAGKSRGYGIGAVARR
jgi:hypothetical protein